LNGAIDERQRLVIPAMRFPAFGEQAVQER
jgi:hypothetical protein